MREKKIYLKKKSYRKGAQEVRAVNALEEDHVRAFSRKKEPS